MPSTAMWDSWAQRPCCPPFLVGKTPASMAFSDFQSAEQFLIKGEAASKLSEAEAHQKRPTTSDPARHSLILSATPPLWNCRQKTLTLCEPMDCSPPGSSVHGVLQARILEWVAISFCRGSSRPRNRTWVSCTSRWVLYHWAPGKPKAQWVCPKSQSWKGWSQALYPGTLDFS